MNAWIKRKNGPDEVIKVIQDIKCTDASLVYNLFTAFDDTSLGRILFDQDGYWIYDGEQLAVIEQEQLGKFIVHNMEVLWSS
ncbi:hypothetical protein GWR56_15345 [Mucilaginibacter sp. 14171R-50]|uniref:hypothetical protein n=1 Tax=Mucilaginibacter sp. 14171R-50 TaxID=2703789 RepID=UPI00138D4043|nr:hypothetical protein [Mucilaginibacter sp. 14171R-50]QHS56851.1 hypothetical protein GWR56_15345 [Mucilaginibacter sp. 14171R-50]